MALKQEKKLKGGLVMPDAYTRIFEVKFGWRRGIVISVRTHTDEAARRGGDPDIFSESINIPWNKDEMVGDVTILEYAYSKLKLNENYRDAENV